MGKHLPKRIHTECSPDQLTIFLEGLRINVAEAALRRCEQHYEPRLKLELAALAKLPEYQRVLELESRLQAARDGAKRAHAELETLRTAFTDKLLAGGETHSISRELSERERELGSCRLAIQAFEDELPKARATRDEALRAAMDAWNDQEFPKVVSERERTATELYGAVEGAFVAECAGECYQRWVEEARRSTNAEVVARYAAELQAADIETKVKQSAKAIASK